VRRTTAHVSATLSTMQAICNTASPRSAVPVTTLVSRIRTPKCLDDVVNPLADGS
jgi:hypothetical protein